jgi:tRNA(adenine34) deaminase
MTYNHEHWMRSALELAVDAMKHGEIPVASVLVGGDHKIAEGQTQVRRRGSIAAHGELFTLLEAKGEIWTADRPLIVYTTLEPCLMCLGAMIQTGVDEVVYGMDAAPDGGTRYADAIKAGGQTPPKVTAHILEYEQVALMRDFLRMHPDSPAIPYVRDMLRAYPIEADDAGRP